MVARIVGPTASKPNMRILKVLEKDSEVLSRIEREFHALLQSRNTTSNDAGPIHITCFYEELRYPGFGEVVSPITVASTPRQPLATLLGCAY
jgi:hypothetical protein